MIDNTAAVDALGEGFASATVDVNGTTLHYVRGGAGPALVLLHGFPQDWFEWRRVLPRLAQRFTVIAVDQRGVGGSAAATEGFAAPDLAEDVHRLLEKLGTRPAHVVGHDIGGWVAYALARRYPASTRTVLIMETALPGIEPNVPPGVPLWHAEFHMIAGLPEALVAGREAIYFRHFLDVGTVGDDVVDDAEVEHYAAAYDDPERLRSAFEVYRAIPANYAFNAGSTDPVDVPLLLVGGEQVFGQVMHAMAETLRERHGWSDVAVEIVAGGRHYLPEEYPDEVATLIERHCR